MRRFIFILLFFIGCGSVRYHQRIDAEMAYCKYRWAYWLNKYDSLAASCVYETDSLRSEINHKNSIIDSLNYIIKKQKAKYARGKKGF